MLKGNLFQYWITRSGKAIAYTLYWIFFMYRIVFPAEFHMKIIIAKRDTLFSHNLKMSKNILKKMYSDIKNNDKVMSIIDPI